MAHRTMCGINRLSCGDFWMYAQSRIGLCPNQAIYEVLQDKEDGIRYQLLGLRAHFPPCVIPHALVFTYICGCSSVTKSWFIILKPLNQMKRNSPLVTCMCAEVVAHGGDKAEVWGATFYTFIKNKLQGYNLQVAHTLHAFTKTIYKNLPNFAR